MSLPLAIIAVLAHFEPCFTHPTWRQATVLLIGTFLARGRRTVAAALRLTGHTHDPHFALFHHVLNRARWTPLAVSHRLLLLLVATFVPPDAPVEIIVDEHLERRWGPQITKRSHYRDPLLSGKGLNVANSGLRWVVFALVVHVPWTARYWALPFLAVCMTPPQLDVQRTHAHRSVPDVAGLLLRRICSWLPGRKIALLGDNTYGSIELGLVAHDANVALISPIRMDANLFAPPPPRQPGQRGAPRVKGAALPKLTEILRDPQTAWTSVTLPWYDGKLRSLQYCSGTALWYHTGKRPLPLRWVLVRDPSGQQEPRAFRCTDQEQAPVRIITDYIKRWPLEVTFEESRAHLGIETQRQWSDLAIERSTPALLGLYSLVALFAQALYPDGQIPVATAAWYPKTQATFSDVLMAVRRALWNNFNYQTCPHQPDMQIIPQAELARLAYAVCC
jgi:DDE superfamily endonuclease